MAIGLGTAPEQLESVEQWTFLTNHAHVLLSIARDPGIRLRDVALAVGITERATQRIVADLVKEGYVSRTRVGRRNRYEIHMDVPLRHPVEHHRPIGAFLQAFVER
jgi:DNA-binding MarR family transcriptional regulator